MIEDRPPLSPARFAALVEAYGGTIARWPKAVREEAERLSAHDPVLRALLTQADALDTRLDRWRVPPPSPALHQRIAAARRYSLTRRIRLWWTGIGLAAAMAGAAAGSIAAAATVEQEHTPPTESTLFGDIGWQEA